MATTLIFVVFPFLVTFHLGQKKFMVVGMSHGDDPQFFVVLFLVTFLLGQKKLTVVAMSHGDDPQFFLVPFLVTFLLGQEKIEGRRHESRRRPSTCL